MKVEILQITHNRPLQDLTQIELEFSKRKPQKGQYIDNAAFEQLIIKFQSMDITSPEYDDVRTELWLSFTLLATGYTSKYGNQDLVTDAVVVCMRKVKRFDPKSGVAFGYFTTVIQNEIRQLHRKEVVQDKIKKKYFNELYPDTKRRNGNAIGENPIGS